MKRGLVVVQDRYGDPESVVTVKEEGMKTIGPNDIQVRVVCSPINPADINMIEGRYIRLPQLPIVLGNEGVGVVMAVGANVTAFCVGDRVIAPYYRASWFGWWCEAVVADARYFYKIPEGVSDEVAAMLSVNSITAFQMLNQFCSVKKGGWVIQNLASSAVGRCVIDVAKSRGVHTINIVRREEDKSRLIALGADWVMTEKALFSRQFDAELKAKHCLLALNGVGGQSAYEMLRCLDDTGVMVTYGAMAKEPIRIPNYLLIYKDCRCVGFNRTRWVQESSHDVITSVVDQVVKLAVAGLFQVPVVARVPLGDIREGIRLAMQPGKGGKVLLTV